MVTGESFFITSFTHKGSGKGHVAFGTPFPGKVIALDMGDLGGRFLCQKDAYLCSADGVNVEVAFSKKIGAGLFGGEGFILQRLEGEGMADRIGAANGPVLKEPGERSGIAGPEEGALGGILGGDMSF